MQNMDVTEVGAWAAVSASFLVAKQQVTLNKGKV